MRSSHLDTVIGSPSRSSDRCTNWSMAPLREEYSLQEVEAIAISQKESSFLPDAQLH